LVEAFHEICEGPISVELMGVLRLIENSERKKLIRAFFSQLDVQGHAFIPAFEEAWGLLVAVEDVAPSVVDEIIMLPAVGLWLRRAVEVLVTRSVGTSSTWTEMGVLHAVAAAAAIRAGVDCSIKVPIVQGIVNLPSVGSFTVSVSKSVDFVLLSHIGSRIVLSVAGERIATSDDGALREIRRHLAATGSAELDVVFDDCDPQRTFVDSPAVPDPLTDVEFKQWGAQLDEAWSILVDWHPGYAAELSAGLMSIVPLTREGRLVGASSAAAFGAIALSDKPSADELADALVHELQHSKLNAVFEVLTLHDAGDEWFHAPWRDDPRPLNGVLHGIYAFTSVVEFWGARRHLVPEDQAAEADFAFVLRALQVRLAIEELAAAPLNEWGRLFLDTVSRRLAACEAGLTHTERTGPVAKIVDDRRVLWRIKHVQPDAGHIGVLADAWSTGRTAPVGFRVDSKVSDHMVCAVSDRAPLLKAYALAAGRTPDVPGADEADLAYARGDLRTAAAAYRRRIGSNADDEQAWVGLALAQGSDVLLHEPEIVLALQREVVARTGDHPDPVLLAEWLTDGDS
jgi:HEXXH motif-containing protein